MKQTLKLSFEMTNTLSRIEHNGLKINTDTLEDIEKQYMEAMLGSNTKQQYKEAMLGSNTKNIHAKK